MEASPDITVIGIEEEATPEPGNLVEAAPTTVISVAETLYEAVGDEFETGERLGELEGVYVVGHRGQAVCALRFSFGDEDSITAAGTLPFDKGRVRSGVLTVTGGTGNHRTRGGQVRVRVQNPKRYEFEP